MSRASQSGERSIEDISVQRLLKERDLYQGLLDETEAFAGLFQTHDQKEGMAAFLAKRQPKFKDAEASDYPMAALVDED